MACSCGFHHLPLNDDREREGKSRALARLRLDPDLAAVHLNDPLGDGQPQAGATFLLGDGIVGLLELLKQPRLTGSGDAGSRVTDRDMECAIVSFGLDGDFARIRELNGVAHKIDQDLRQAAAIAAARRQFGSQLELERELFVGR